MEGMKMKKSLYIAAGVTVLIIAGVYIYLRG